MPFNIESTNNLIILNYKENDSMNTIKDFISNIGTNNTNRQNKLNKKIDRIISKFAEKHGNINIKIESIASPNDAIYQENSLADDKQKNKIYISTLVGNPLIRVNHKQSNKSDRSVYKIRPNHTLLQRPRTAQLNVLVQPNVKKYAIIFLCMLNPLYIVGACIQAYMHKKFLCQQSKLIELVIMCDDYIHYNYGTMLEQYFDRVKRIQLRCFKVDEKYINKASDNWKKKYTWIGYATSKWEVLQYDEYDKILFLDTDILPASVELYNIFDMPTPGFYNTVHKNNCVDGASYKVNIDYDFKQYIENHSDIGTINGGICLLKPSKKDYHDYVEYTLNIFKDGIYSMTTSGPDETSLFYFYASKSPIYDICEDYMAVPWEKNNNNVKLYNFVAYKKPWAKPLFISWAEETIWHDIYKKMPKNEYLHEIYNMTKIEYIKNFVKSDISTQKHYNNTKWLDRHPNALKEIIDSGYSIKTIEKYEKMIQFENYGKLRMNI